MRPILNNNLYTINITNNTGINDEISSLSLLMKDLDILDKASKIVEPWEILLDLGHYLSYNYN